MPRKFSGAACRAKRVAAGLRPEYVALQIHRTHYAVSSYELDRCVPSTTILAAMADLYGCAIDDFFTKEIADVAG